MTDHEVVTREEWVEARKKHLAREKELTRLRDQISRERRELPWVRVDKDYRFHGARGEQSLADLFGARSQLFVYHFMFGPDWEEGCKSCSFWSDHFDPLIVHLGARDVALAVVSRAPYEKLKAFSKRMGWRFNWVSSEGSDFNFDYHVSFTPEEMEKGEVYYNYRKTRFPSEEAHGLSTFFKDDDGAIYHTYSSYSRGLDMLNACYHILDLMPKGRDEDDFDYSMTWLRHHDRYEG